MKLKSNGVQAKLIHPINIVYCYNNFEHTHAHKHNIHNPHSLCHRIEINIEHLNKNSELFTGFEWLSTVR